MLINFTKMHGLGNDFVVIDMLSQHARLQSAHFKKMADRRFGIGCDQVLLIEPPRTPKSDFYFRIFNPDGHEAEHCGNGARCVGRFVYDTGLIFEKNMVIGCLAGKLHVALNEDDSVSVSMGPLVPFPPEKKVITINNKSYTTYYTTLGNPHAVVVVDDLQAIKIASLGAKISTHTAFESPLNVSFMQIRSQSEVALRVYERGAGPTHSCGSASVAAVGCGQALGQLNNKVQVVFEHGSVEVKKKGAHNFTLTGPATRLFVGRFRV